MGIAYYDKVNIVNKLKEEMVGVKKVEDPASKVTFSTKYDGATGTIYCNIFGQEFKESDLKDAYSYYCRKAESETDKVKRSYHKMASMAIYSILQSRFDR